MEIEISRDIENKVERASQELGLSKKEIVARALQLYLLSIKDYIELKEEIDTWEEAGRQDLSRWENESL